MTPEETTAALGVFFGLMKKNDYLNMVDSFADALISQPDAIEVECPVKHRFTPGLYIREIFMPAGTKVISAIHRYEHPFVISQGVVKVYDEYNEFQLLRAPHTGITLQGTCRLLSVEEDCIWTTFHTTNKTDVAEILDDIIIKRPTVDGKTPMYLRNLN